MFMYINLRVGCISVDKYNLGHHIARDYQTDEYWNINLTLLMPSEAKVSTSPVKEFVNKYY